MASLTDIQTAIRRTVQNLDNALEAEALRMAADAAALIEDRITQTGRKSDGQPLTPYSEKQAPAYLYYGRSRTAAGEQRVRQKAKKREGISYKEFRALNGLNTTPKTLEFTGEMWQGFGVKDVRRIRRGVLEVTIGGKNQRTESLLGYHSERERTQITEPSRQELAQIQRGLSERLKKILSINV